MKTDTSTLEWVPDSWSRYEHKVELLARVYADVGLDVSAAQQAAEADLAALYLGRQTSHLSVSAIC